MTAHRVLIVDPTPDNAHLLEYLLTAAGIETVVVGTARDCLLEAAREPPNLILLDLHLPDADGYRVVELLRAREQTQPIPIVAVTAAVMPDDREHVMAAGFDGYIAKPIEPEHLIGQITPYLIGGDDDVQRLR